MELFRQFIPNIKVQLDWLNLLCNNSLTINGLCAAHTMEQAVTRAIFLKRAISFILIDFIFLEKYGSQAYIFITCNISTAKIMLVCLMVFNATFKNISVISWRAVLLVEETRGPGENHRPVASHWQTWPHSAVHLALIEIRTHNISGDIGTDCIGSCKFNYHTITSTTAPRELYV